MENKRERERGWKGEGGREGGRERERAMRGNACICSMHAVG